MALFSVRQDPLRDFSEGMSRWFSGYRAMERTWGQDPGEGAEGRDTDCSRLPVDTASSDWTLHVLDCGHASGSVQSGLSSADLDLPDPVESCRKLLLVTDSAGLPLGFDFLPAGALEADGGHACIPRIVGLLQQSMKDPLGGGLARRPLTLHVGNAQIHRLLSDTERPVLSEGLSLSCFQGWSPKEGFSLRWPRPHHCHSCKRHAPLSALTTCPQCQAVLFCSPRCLGADGRSSPAELSHQRCCPQLAVFMKHGPPLADLPFTFTAEVTSPDLDMEHFLSCRGLDSGYWMQKSMLVRPANWELESQAEQSKHSTPGTQQPYGPLHKESEMLLCGCPRTPPALNAPLVSWLQYYEWRGLDLSSPVCVLLSPTLTIYHIITCLVPRDFPDLNILKKQSLRIHFLEAERHYSTPLIFWELSALLPHVTFELLFVGEGLPQTCVDKQHQLLQIKGGRVTLLSFGPENRKAKKSIRVKGYRWTYDLFQGPKPDLVIGFRSDFCLSNSWMSILHRLQSLRVPAYFCESSELSCVSGQPVMAAATGGSLSSPSLNPFHCPLRITGTDHCLPCYSNAFIFHLVYKPPPQARREQQDQQQPPPPQAFPPGPQRRGDRVKMKQREKKQAGRNMPRRKK